MRILISADIGGASGVVDGAETGCGAEAQRALTGDINAAVEGAMEAGAASFVLHDSHGPNLHNVLLEELHPMVEVVRGRPLFFYEEADLARGYDGAMMIGMHARAGEAAVLSRVLDWPLLREVRLNGQPVGEAELTAALAGAYGIPTVLITGDDRVCADIQRWSHGHIEAAVVKYSLSRYAARCLSLIESRERIRCAAARAVERIRCVQPAGFAPPITMEVEMNDREMARICAWMPGVGYDGERTICYTDDDYCRVYRCLLAMFRIATSSLNP